MSAQDQLRKNLLRRYDGHWEMLATAFGSKEAVSRSVEGLTSVEIDKGAHGQAFAPSIIHERVEAIAARDPKLLIGLSSQWKPVHDIAGDYWWTAAWTKSLRHLKNLGVVRREDIDVAELEHEASILWAMASAKAFSWRSVINNEDGKLYTYDFIRRTSVDSMIEDRLLPEDIIDAPIVTFRLLRNKTAQLDSRTYPILTQRLYNCIDIDPFGAAILIEICDEIGISVREELCLRLLRVLPEINEPLSIAELCYVLLTDWRLP